MAVVSEGILYQAGIAPSYVSSSGYYGYVPPCPIADYENAVVRRQQLGRLVEANDQTASIAVSTGDWTLSSGSFSMPVAIDNRHEQQQQQQQQRQQLNNQQLICLNGSAMETDEDDNCRSEYLGVSRCQNNHCVIPEAAGRPYGNGCERFYRVVEQQRPDACGRGNRKRNSAGDPAHLFAAGQPANHAKRSRQDGGNGNVRNGSGCSGKRGSSSLHYEQAPLSDIGEFGVYRLRESFSDSTSSIVEGDCRTAAGNYDDIGRSEPEPPCIVATNCCDEKFGESYLDYEIMLMETHGCSSYHYGECRRLDYDFAEAEF